MLDILGQDFEPGRACFATKEKRNKKGVSAKVEFDFSPSYQNRFVPNRFAFKP